MSIFATTMMMMMMMMMMMYYTIRREIALVLFQLGQHILFEDSLEQHNVNETHHENKDKQGGQIGLGHSMSIADHAVENKAQNAESKQQKRQYIHDSVYFDNHRVRTVSVESEQFASVQENAVKLHEQSHDGVAQVENVHQVIGKGEQHYPVVHANDPLFSGVTVGVNVVEVVEEIAAGKGEKQVDVPRDVGEQVFEHFLAEEQNVYEPNAAERRVNEADLQIAIGPDGELNVAIVVGQLFLGLFHVVFDHQAISFFFFFFCCCCFAAGLVSVVFLVGYVAFVGLFGEPVVLLLVYDQVDDQVDKVKDYGEHEDESEWYEVAIVLVAQIVVQGLGRLVAKF